MINLSTLGLPNNFKDLLPELKSKTMKWETNCYSGTDINNYATISFYESLRSPYGNIILTPGLGTNTDIDPLSKMLIFWALTHKFNIITFNTFLGRFYHKPTLQIAQQNTYHEFVHVLQKCITYTENFCSDINIMIGHSAGATGTIDAMNNLAANDKKTKINSVMLFAPWVSIKWFNSMQKNISAHHPDTRDMIPILNIFNTDKKSTGPEYIPVTPKFFHDMTHNQFRPDLMNKWGTNITIIAGEKDKKTFTKLLAKRFEILQTQPNHDKFSFIVLPNAKHSFLEIYKNNQSVISLIKSQKTKLSKK